MPANAGRTAWSFDDSIATSSISSTMGMPDIVAHREGTGWMAHIVWSRAATTSTPQTYYWRVAAASDGTLSQSLAPTSLGNGLDASIVQYSAPSIDFRHNGDGKTVQASTPSVYIAWTQDSSSSRAIKFLKVPYSAGTWTVTTGNTRTLSSTYSAGNMNGLAESFFSCFYDGTRVMVAVVGSTDVPISRWLLLFERDEGDTTTTIHDGGTGDGYLLAGTFSTLRSGQATFDDDGNVYFASHRPGWRMWDRTTGELSDETELASSGSYTRLSIARGPASVFQLDLVVYANTLDPREVQHDRIVLNTLPSAPTGLSFGATTVRRGQDQTLTWTPNDPDGGSPQDTEVRWRTGGGPWTTVTADTLGTNGVAGSGQHTIAADTLAAGQWEFQVRTKDAEDWGAWSSSLFVTFADPPTVTLDDPDDDETIGESPYTVAWTAASQTHYQIRTVADSAGNPDTGTVYTDTGEVASSNTRSRQVAYAQNGLTVHTQLRVKAGGVWSDWQSHRNPIAYTPPLTPEVVVGLNPANSPVNGTPAGIYQQISATHPEPDDEPEPTSITISRQEQHPITEEWGIWRAGTWQTGGTLTIAEGVDPDAVVTDTRVANRREYRYRVAAVAATGAASLSDWSDELIDDGGGPVDEYDTIDDGGAP